MQLLVHCIIVLSVLIVKADCSLNNEMKRYDWVRRSKRQVDEETQCPITDDVKKRFFEWYTLRNETHVTFLHPSVQTERRQAPLKPRHGKILTNNNIDLCSKPRDFNHGHKQRENALCPWHWVSNHDPQRIPATMAEIKCDCAKVNANGVPYECHTVKHGIPVMKHAGSDCYAFVAQIEHVSLGCVAMAAKSHHEMANPPIQAKDLMGTAKTNVE